MSSPKHAAVRDEISLQLQSSPHFKPRGGGVGNGREDQAEQDAFISDSPSKSSPHMSKWQTSDGKIYSWY